MAGLRLPRAVSLTMVAVAALLAGAGSALALTPGRGPAVAARDTPLQPPVIVPSGSPTTPGPAPSPVFTAPSGPSGVPAGPSGVPTGGNGPVVAPPGAGGMSGVQHREFRVPMPSGGYARVFLQRGNVTSVSSAKITVRCHDGYTRTYQLTGSTSISVSPGESVKTGQRVAVVAVIQGSQAQAVSIIDLSDLPPGTYIGSGP